MLECLSQTQDGTKQDESQIRPVNNFSVNSTSFHIKTERAASFSLGNKFFTGRNLQMAPHLNVILACVQAFAHATGRR